MWTQIYTFVYMQIRLLAFGIAKDIVGGRTVQLEVAEPCTVSDLKQMLTQQFPEFVKLRSLQLAVNQSYAQDSLLLESHDEVVIIPPVSGG